MHSHIYVCDVAFTQEQTAPERAVRKTSPPVPLANLLSCMRRLVSAICERRAVMNENRKTCNLRDICSHRPRLKLYDFRLMLL